MAASFSSSPAGIFASKGHPSDSETNIGYRELQFRPRLRLLAARLQHSLARDYEKKLCHSRGLRLPRGPVRRPPLIPHAETRVPQPLLQPPTTRTRTPNTRS